MWSPRSLLAAAIAGLFLFGAIGGASAQVRIDIPGRRPSGDDGPSTADVIGGLLALKGGYDRSRRGHICVLTYDDANGDGARDRKEGALPGWTFTLTDSAGRPVAQGVTDGKGRFCNEKPLPPGAYTVSETAGGGWFNTDPGGWTAPVTLPADRSVVVLFGNCRGERCGPRSGPGPRGPIGPAEPVPGPDAKFKARICVTKFEDTNGNGVRDGNEWTLASWQMTVRNGAGAVVASGTTNNQGEYCTPGTLIPGPYTVSETLNGGWISTTPGGVTRSLVLQMGQTWSWAFGNQRIPSTWVCVKKFNDLNGDGVRQSNEPGLHWTFGISGPNGPLPDMITGNGGGACNSGPYSAGVYTVTDGAQPGWAATTPGGAVQTFTLTPTHPVNLLFGNRQVPAAARVCVTKYNDLNGNGMRDAGEPLLPGWIFKVVNTAGAIVAFGPTNAQGQWCSTATLVSGPATILETTKPGWVSTDPGGGAPNKPVTLVSGQTVNVAFGNRMPPPPPVTGKLCVSKFHDLDGNGARVSAEPLMAGWQFNITGPSGPITLTTAANGSACTPSTLLLGSYVVTEVMQAGWASTAPGGPSPQRTVTVTAGLDPNVMFGNWRVKANQICVLKFNDLNQNRVRNPGEAPLAGWTFEVRDAAGVLVATGTTDAEGRYCTPATLPPGAYTVHEVPQPGWASTDPTGPPPWNKTVTLPAGKGVQTSFGNVRAGRICIVKYNDLDGDGARDANEPFLPGWPFHIQAGMGWGNYTTGPAGRVCGPDMPPGTYHAVEHPVTGWSMTDPAGSFPGKPAVVVAGQTTVVQFGNHQDAPPAPGLVCIVKYNDIDQDAVFDPGEARLPGWQFNLKTAAGVAVGTVTTGQAGRVCRELPPGTYAAFEIPQAGWSNSDPVGPALDKPFTIAAGQTVNLVFGNYQPPVLRFRKVVLSNAPGGGFPLTGLTSGNRFQVLHSCVLGNQTGGNMTLVPANGVAPMAGYTGSSVGAVCTTSETPPPGLIAFAPCATGKGHWATPIITPQPLTIAGGMNEITVTNQFVCEKAPPPPMGKLCVHKFNDLNADASFALSEPGLAGWQFTVTGPSGPITLVTGANGRACTGATLLFGSYTVTETPQAGWVSTLPGGTAPQTTVAVTAAGIPSVTFGNRVVIPPPPRLTISKSFDSPCTSVIGVTNPCVFRVRILNVAATAYVGPAAFSDTVGFIGGITVANSTVLAAPLPSGWSCSTNGPPINCTGSVNLAPGQFVDIVLTMNLFHPVMPLKNCVSLTAPITAGPACVPF